MTMTGTTPSPAALTTRGAPPSVTVGPVASGALGIPLGAAGPTYQISVTDPIGDGYDESFIVQFPGPNAYPAPVLVAFHAYGVSEKDITKNTTFPQECAQRGWILLAPLGATQISYSSLQAQDHIALVLKLLTTMWASEVDHQRIYGVGFSMGGGSALNYAARHLDPAKPMFAALANHTGEIAHIDTYRSDPGTHWILEYWFGGPPVGHEFEYMRSSLLDFNPITLAVDMSSDLARNLTHVPVHSWHASSDPLTYLKEQTQVLHSHLLARGGSSTIKSIPAFQHSWSTLNEKEVCDWLSQYSLTLPTSAETLADHDGTYFWFDVHQDAAGAFTPFTWDADAAANRLTISATENLKQLDADTAGLGLDTSQDLEVVLSTADGLADYVVLSGYAVPPSNVLRDGVHVPPAMWVHTPGVDTLELLESDGSVTHTWAVQP